MIAHIVSENTECFQISFNLFGGPLCLYPSCLSSVMNVGVVFVSYYKHTHIMIDKLGPSVCVQTQNMEARYTC